MYRLAGVLSAVLLFAFAANGASALEELVGCEGRSAMVEVLETTFDSLTVEYKRGETTIKAVVPAKSLDPHCFYTIRRKYMEDTADNHLRLAGFCLRNDLLGLGKKHYDIAVAMDPELAAERKAENAELLEKFADKVLAEAKQHAEKGEFDKAEFKLSFLGDVLPETKAGAEVGALMAAVQEKRAEKDAADAQAKLDKIADEAARKAAEARAKELKPVLDSRETARKMLNEGLRADNQSKARGYTDQSIAQYKSTLTLIGNRKKTESSDPAVAQELADLETSVTAELVHAYVVGGGIYLSRSAYNDAEEYARAALAVDPSSQEAQGFLVRVQNALAYKDDIDVRSRRPRGGGGRR